MIYVISTLIVLVVVAIGMTAFVRTWRKINLDRRKLQWMASKQYTLLMVQVPKLNDKTPLAAEQMFASLHGIYSSVTEFQEHISFEIVAEGSSIRFYVFTPVHLRDFVEGQIYAQYPTVEIVQVEDYTRTINFAEDHIVGTELEMTKPDVYPIKTFVNFNVDPLAGITSTLAKMADNEKVWIQLLIRPVDDSWQERGTRLIDSIRKGKTTGGSIVGGVVKSVATLATDTVREAASPGSISAESVGEKKEVKPELSGPVESALKGVEEKITKLGFSTKIRILAVAPDVYTAQSKISGVVGAFKQFNTTNLNGFTSTQLLADDKTLWDKYAARHFDDGGLVLNIEELASVYHLPNMTVETPNIVWTTAKKGEPPSNLPLVGIVPPNLLTVIGKTNFRNIEKEFGIKLLDRRRHTYVIGKSGTGKSTLLENMIIDDIREGRGVILVDPHGEAVEHVLDSVPKERINDVVLFDPSDRANPIGFNLLESVDEDLKGIVASGFVGIFKKIFGNSWGPRLEHILRNSVLALLDYPDSTMLGIVKMLTDKRYRQMVVAEVKDPVIKDFWENEFAGWDQKFASEATSPILNKVGQFIATPTIRNIVGQPQSTFSVRQIMDEGKILLINLSRGKIGEDNSALLGAMMITKIQLAAMSRADIPEGDRTDSYLYVDEFQNFATESFATILSEARKYHLNLIMANQYIAQMQEEVRDAVFGNVGTLISFRVGAGDAGDLAHEFTPVFAETDLVNQDIYKIYIKLSIDGLTGPAFSANALPPYKPEVSHAAEIAEVSRQAYSRSRAEVEAQIDAHSRGEEKDRLPGHLQGIPDGAIELPAIKIKQENIVYGQYYTELSAAGAVKWWEGRPLEEVMEDEEKKRQKFLTKKIERLKEQTDLSTIMEKKEHQDDDDNGPQDGGESGENQIVTIKNEKEEVEEPEVKGSDVAENQNLDENVADPVEENPDEQGNGAATLRQDYGKAEPPIFEEKLSEKGSGSGERVQERNVTTISPSPESNLTPEQNSAIGENTAQFASNGSNDANMVNTVNQAQIEHVDAEPLPQRSKISQTAPNRAQNTPIAAQKPLQSPTSPQNSQDNQIDARPGILQHFLPQTAPKDIVAPGGNDTGGVAPSSALGELTEGESLVLPS